MSCINKHFIIIAILASAAFSAAPVKASDFSLAVGPGNQLIVRAPDGSEAAVLNAPTVGQAVTVGPVSVQLSYGRDINDLLSAIVAPDPSNPKAVSYTVCGNTISASPTSYVTIAFAPNLQDISVDPGFVGSVSVNGQAVTRSFATSGFSREPAVQKVSTTPAPAGSSPSAAPSMPATAQSAPAPSSRQWPVADPGSRPTVAPSYASRNPSGRSPHGSGSSLDTFSPSAPTLAPSIGPDTQPESGMTAVNAATTVTPAPATAPTSAPISTASSQQKDTESRVKVPGYPPLVRTTAFYGAAGSGPANGGSGSTPASNPKQLKSPWAEPVTPPSGSLPQISSNEIMLMEVQGPVMVQKPGSADLTPATDGMKVPTGTRIVTKSGASTAALLGGVNSVRFGPDSEGKVNQNVDGAKRSTTIDLSKGLVFSKVGRKAGETQDFKVKTPNGVAAAKGTDFVVLTAPYVVSVIQGSVSVFDNDGNLLGTADAGPDGTPGIFAPSLSDDEKQEILNKILDIANQFNLKTNALLDKIDRGEGLTPEEQAFLDRAPGIYYLVEAPGEGNFFPNYSLVPSPLAEELAPGNSSNNPLVALERSLDQIYPLDTPGAFVVPVVPPPTTPF